MSFLNLEVIVIVRFDYSCIVNESVSGVNCQSWDLRDFFHPIVCLILGALPVDSCSSTCQSPPQNLSEAMLEMGQRSDGSCRWLPPHEELFSMHYQETWF